MDTSAVDGTTQPLQKQGSLFSLGQDLTEMGQALFADPSVIDLIREAGPEIFELVNAQAEREKVHLCDREENRDFPPGSNTFL
jgi:hypothetical protein